ncbi:putative nuclease HARBI1 [Ornithodoros turicata]|uniref:putative nuclease HARBI1 n=1 Tax=Ornithodoros turicata TaxID=34597 RepID=UPI003139E518
MEVPIAAWVRRNSVRRTFRPYIDAFEATDEEFMRMYRLTKPVVRWLCDQLRSTLRAKRRTRTALSVERQILIALRFYATGSFQVAVASDRHMAVTQSTISKALFKVTNAVLLQLAPLWIRFPTEPDEIREVMRAFKTKWRLPGLIGCVDGSVIGILAPSERSGQYQKSAFFCRKQYFAINAMIVCDASMRITSMDCSFSGGAHDAYVWRHSELKCELSRRHSDEPRFLLGDSGYPLQPWLLTPLPGDPPPNTPEARYNRRHKAARGIVEKCIGLLKSRFRCLQRYRTLHYIPHRASNIVVACTVLHNICMHARAPPTEDAGEGDDDDGGEDTPAATSSPNADAPPDREIYDIGAAVRARVIEQLSRH